MGGPFQKKDAGRITVIAGGMFLCVSFSICLLAKTKLVSRLENGSFAASVRSVLEDHDLNLIKQVYPEQRWLVTPTYNSPDIREKGSVALWLPFFAYARGLPAPSFGPRPWGDPVNQEDLATALGTLFYSLATLILTFRLLQHFAGDRHAKTSLIALAVGTPVVWYTLFEPYGTDLTSNFAITAAIFLYVLLRGNPSLSKGWWFLLGAALGYAASVKVYGIIYLALIGQVALRWFMNGKKVAETKRLGALVAGLALILACSISNLYLKFGTLGLGSQYRVLLGYAPIFKSQFFQMPFTQLFGSSGAFFVSPIYLISSVGAAVWLWDKRKRPALEALLSVRVALVVAQVALFIAWAFMPQACLVGSGRRLMANQLIFVVMLQALLSRAESLGPKLYRALVILVGVATAWNLAMLARYGYDSDGWADLHFIPVRQWAGMILAVTQRIIDSAGIWPAVALALLRWTPVLLACSCLLLVLSRLTGGQLKQAKQAKQAVRALWGTAPFLAIPVALYVASSVMNLAFNRANVERLRREGFFVNTVVGNGMDLFVYDELMSLVPKLRHSAEFHQDTALSHETDELVSQLLRQAAPEAAIDPIGFRADSEKGKARPSFFDKDRP